MQLGRGLSMDDSTASLNTHGKGCSSIYSCDSHSGGSRDWHSLCPTLAWTSIHGSEGYLHPDGHTLSLSPTAPQYLL